jgi:hypothetical protein
MSELNDNTDLRTYSTAVLYVLSAVNPPPDYLKVIITRFVNVIKSSTVRINIYLTFEYLPSNLPVLAHSLECITYASRVFLPQPYIDFSRRCFTSYGCISRLSGRRERRSSGNVIESFIRYYQVFAEGKYCAAEGE